MTELRTKLLNYFLDWDSRNSAQPFDFGGIHLEYCFYYGIDGLDRKLLDGLIELFDTLLQERIIIMVNPNNSVGLEYRFYKENIPEQELFMLM